MKIQNGQTVLLTGASGGLGSEIARRLASHGMRMVLTAYPGIALEGLCNEVRALGSEASFVVGDLRDSDQRRQLLDETHRRLGSIDLLINNAGVEHTGYLDRLSDADVTDLLRVNLEAPMLLTKAVLPGMVARQRGHVVNVASLAGRAGPAFQEPYSATKAGLIALTYSLRATYRGSGVSASAIVPGFVEAGIYADLKRRTGCSAPALLGTSPVQAVSAAVIRAIEKDLPEVFVNKWPVRPLLALLAIWPSLGERAIAWTGANRFFRRVVEAEAAAHPGSP